MCGSEFRGQKFGKKWKPNEASLVKYWFEVPVTTWRKKTVLSRCCNSSAKRLWIISKLAEGLKTKCQASARCYGLVFKMSTSAELCRLLQQVCTTCAKQRVCEALLTRCGMRLTFNDVFAGCWKCLTHVLWTVDQNVVMRSFFCGLLVNSCGLARIILQTLVCRGHNFYKCSRLPAFLVILASPQPQNPLWFRGYLKIQSSLKAPAARKVLQVQKHSV